MRNGNKAGTNVANAELILLPLSLMWGQLQCRYAIISLSQVKLYFTSKEALVHADGMC